MEHLDLEQIQQFLKARLDAQSRARALEHLGECFACRRTLEDERRFARMLELADLPPIPEPRLQRAIQRVEADRVRRSRRHSLAAAALAGIGIAVGILAGQPFRRSAVAGSQGTTPGVASAIEADAVRNLDELIALHREPDPIVNLEMLQTFVQLLEQRRPPALPAQEEAK